MSQSIFRGINNLLYLISISETFQDIEIFCCIIWYKNIICENVIPQLAEEHSYPTTPHKCIWWGNANPLETNAQYFQSEMYPHPLPFLGR